MGRSSKSGLLKDKKFKKDILYIEKYRSSWSIKKYLDELEKVSKKAPNEIVIQAWYAAIYGDYGQTLTFKKEVEYKKRAVKILLPLSRKLSRAHTELKALVLNELYYHSFNFLKQYQLGIRLENSTKGSGLFSIGVGAAEYSYVLFKKNQFSRATFYGERSKNAWEKLGKRYTTENPFYVLSLAMSGNIKKANEEFLKIRNHGREYNEFKRFYDEYEKRILDIKSYIHNDDLRLR